MLEVKKAVQGANIEQIDSLETYRYDPNALPIVTLALYGDRSMEDLRYLAERTLGPALERVKGVARAVVTGGLIPEIHCELNAELIHFYGLTINQISQALDQANVSASGGWVEKGNQRYMIRAMGEIKSLDEVQRTVVGYSNGVPIYVTDLGQVRWDYEEPQNMVRFNGKNAVGIALYKEAGSNTVEVVRTIREFFGTSGASVASVSGQQNNPPVAANMGGNEPDGAQYIPKGTHVEIAYDQSLFITKSIDEVKYNAIEGAGLSVVILIIFLRNLRTTFIVSLAIPVSMLATFILMYFMNLSLNIMTLGGLALGSGMLVDCAIVVVENIFRRIQIGDSPKIAAIRGAGEVASAIAASTLTSVVVFVPIAYMGGVTAELFKEQALTVVFSHMMSLLVALVMIPSLCSKYMTQVTVVEERQGLYARFLTLAVNHRFATILISFFLCMTCVPIVKTIKQEFIPQAAETQFIVKARMPAGTRIESTENMAKDIEGWLLQDIGDSIQTVYHAGWPQTGRYQWN